MAAETLAPLPRPPLRLRCASFFLCCGLFGWLLFSTGIAVLEYLFSIRVDYLIIDQAFVTVPGMTLCTNSTQNVLFTCVYYDNKFGGAPCPYVQKATLSANASLFQMAMGPRWQTCYFFKPLAKPPQGSLNINNPDPVTPVSAFNGLWLSQQNAEPPTGPTDYRTTVAPIEILYSFNGTEPAAFSLWSPDANPALSLRWMTPMWTQDTRRYVTFAYTDRHKIRRESTQRKRELEYSIETVPSNAVDASSFAFLPRSFGVATEREGFQSPVGIASSAFALIGSILTVRAIMIGPGPYRPWGVLHWLLRWYPHEHVSVLDDHLPMYLQLPPNVEKRETTKHQVEVMVVPYDQKKEAGATAGVTNGKKWLARTKP